TSSNALVADTDTAIGTITDNDSATADLSVTTQGDETGPVAIVYTVTLDNANNTGAPITFDLSDTGAGTATAGSDYALIPVGAQVSVAAGATTGTYTVAVSDDALLEAAETVEASISNPSNAAVTITGATATATITDNDTATLTVGDVTVDEAAGTLSFDVSVDNAVEGGFTVDYSFTDGTATGGS
ncbi:MAG: hypothetical protein GWN45_03675, partial [Gammaproteobacteria bacterium]|nr:hypothetical protein [Gammaproteobacteria bacterium]